MIGPASAPVIDFTKRQNHFAKLAERENGVVLFRALCVEGDVRHAGAFAQQGFQVRRISPRGLGSVIFADFFAG